MIEEASLSTPDHSPPDDVVARAADFVKELVNRYTSYHDHKESMAFTGLTLFAGVAGAGLLSDAWPPSWGLYARPLGALAATVLWISVLAYLRFQLHRRRWAALRIAGCERLLATWITGRPTTGDLTPSARQPAHRSRWTILADFFWPLKCGVYVVKPSNPKKPPEPIYPSALLNAWVAREEDGTDALMHERLIVFAGWVLYVALLAGTLL